MRTSFIALIGLVPSILAAPNSLQPRQSSVCAIPGHPVCCNDIAGIVDFGCIPPSSPPANVADFQNTCSSVFKTARCCELVVIDIGILCTFP